MKYWSARCKTKKGNHVYTFMAKDEDTAIKQARKNLNGVGFLFIEKIDKKAFDKSMNIIL